MGMLTKYLIAAANTNQQHLVVCEIDKESVRYLNKTYPDLDVLDADFLEMDFETQFDLSHQITVIGNFPYNISTQIVFKIIDNVPIVPQMVGMFQKEVAERIASKHDNKVYGILSVLVQLFYEVDYLFTVHENVFKPAPNVKSAVIRFRRKANMPDCDAILLKKIVKMAFNQRRKMLNNALKSMLTPENTPLLLPYLHLRAEQLAVKDFVVLTQIMSQQTL